MVITEPSIASAWLLGLGSKLYPINMSHILKKVLTQFMQSLSLEKSSKRQKSSAAG